MKNASRTSATFVTLMTPLAAFAQGGAPHILLYAMGGGFAGGLIGALLACWLCNRMKGSRSDVDSARR